MSENTRTFSHCPEKTLGRVIHGLCFAFYLDVLETNDDQNLKLCIIMAP